MWTEIKSGTILEVKYYRYLRFLPNGRLLYALLSLPPTDTLKLFTDYLATHPNPPSPLHTHTHTQNKTKEISEGRFYIHKGECICEIRTSYSLIHFRLELQDTISHSYVQTHSHLHFQERGGGKFTQLVMKEHTSVSLTDPSGNNTQIPHKVAYDPFVFWKCASWSG